MLSLLIPPRELKGQPLCDQPAVSYHYDCPTIPEQAPEGAWTALDAWTYDSTWYSDGERLHILAFENGGTAGCYRIEEALSVASMANIEVIASIERHGVLGWLPPIFIGFGISDGEKVVLVWPGGRPCYCGSVPSTSG